MTTIHTAGPERTSTTGHTSALHWGAGLRLATCTEADNWFQNQPALQQMIINDLSRLGTPVRNFQGVHEQTIWYGHPRVGFVPSYALEELDGCTPIWSDASVCGDEREVFEVLWFLVVVRANADEVVSIDIVHATDLEMVLSQLSTEISDLESDIDRYYVNWDGRVFSNGCVFTDTDKLTHVDIDSLEEIASWWAVGYGSPDDLRACVFQSQEDHFYVGIRHFGEVVALMPVESEDEGQHIMEEVW